MIVIDPKVWHARLYMWALAYRCKFLQRDVEFHQTYARNEGTNRCDYLKTILVHLPLILLTQVTAILSLGAAFIYTPYALQSLTGLLRVFGIVAIVVAALCTALAIVYVTETLISAAGAIRHVVKGVGEVSFVSMIGSHIVDKFCPRITFKKEEEQS